MPMPPELKDFFEGNQKLPLLTPKAEKELGEKIVARKEEMEKPIKQRDALIIQKGDAAIDVLVRSNYGLIGRILRIWKSFSLNFGCEEVILEMNDRLGRVAKEFDPKKGRFSTIACLYMINKMRNLYNRALRACVGKFTISINEISPGEKGNNDLSIAEVLRSSEESPLKKLEDKERREILKKALDLIFTADGILNKIEKEVLILRFGLVGSGDTLQGVADMHSLSRERIRQIEESALRKIKLFLKINAFEQKIAS